MAGVFNGAAPPITEYARRLDPSYFPGGMPLPGTLRHPVELSPGYVAVPTQPYNPVLAKEAAARGLLGLPDYTPRRRVLERAAIGFLFGALPGLVFGDLIAGGIGGAAALAGYSMWENYKNTGLALPEVVPVNGNGVGCVVC